MRSILLTATSAVLLACAACSGPSVDTEAPEESSSGTGAETPAGTSENDTTATSSVDAVQLVKLDCGSIYISDLDVFSTAGDYAGKTDTFTDTCWLIRHPEGNLLWDLGLPAMLTSQGEQTTGIYTVSMEQTIAEQLAEIGLSMADLDYLAISHSHFDHVGQADLIDTDNTTWLVNQTEYDVMFPEPEVSDDAPEEGGDETDNLSQFPQFEALTHEIIPDGHDVFGDGSVVIFMTPGHTPGHSSLLVNLPESGPVLLTGDLYHRSESRELKRVPKFNSSEEATRASMEAFEAKADELGATVIIQHEPDDTEALPDVMH